MTDSPRGRETRSGGEEQELAPGSYLAGARASVPFALATFVLAISFGVLARSLGWGILAPIVFSAIAFAGAAQFAVAAVLGDGGGALAAIIAAVLLRARFVPMGVAIAPYLKGGPLRRALEGQAVVDASWALASRGGGRFDGEFMLGATVLLIAWIGGTVVGVLGGNFIGDPEEAGAERYLPRLLPRLTRGRTRRRGTRAVAHRSGAGARPRAVHAPRRAGHRRLRGSAPRSKKCFMTTLWIVIVIVTLTNVVIKAAQVHCWLEAENCLRAR